MSKTKKKKRSSKLTINPMDLLRSIRKPRAPATKVLKDKKVYTRKQKHKKGYEEEE